MGAQMAISWLACNVQAQPLLDQIALGIAETGQNTVLDQRVGVAVDGEQAGIKRRIGNL